MASGEIFTSKTNGGLWIQTGGPNSKPEYLPCFDVEDIYEKAGWDVTYDTPGYNETYEPKFTFKPSKKK